MKFNKNILIISAIIFGVAVYLIIGDSGFRNLSDQSPNFGTPSPPVQPGPVIETDPSVNEETILTSLDIPWEIAFLPDGQMLVTQRPGSLILFNQNNEIIEIEDVSHIGEGGLLGLAVHPDFEDNNWIYLYLTMEIAGEITNRVERYQFTDNQLTDRRVIIDGIPGGTIHNGGRIKFGPDGYLYITTGDAGEPDLAQNQDSLAGKILRIKDDGSIPEDNPLQNAVWSWGHRNPQGLAWDDQMRLWATEHGPVAQDELNLIQPGENYGWPIITGDQEREDMVSPIIHSGTDTTWAPAGAAYFQGSIYFAGLRGSRLYEYQIGTDQLIEHLVDDYGRLRAVTLENGFLYLSTSNNDGRGNPLPEDDRVIKIDPQGL